MKIFFLSFQFFLFSLLASGQDIQIDENIKIEFDDKEALNVFPRIFVCHNDNPNLQKGSAEVNFVDENILQIVNTYNTGHSGIEISFEIDKDLNVTRTYYSVWDDMENGSTTTYSIELVDFVLSKNPFEEGLANLQGGYKLTIESQYKPGKFFSEEESGSRSETYNYNAHFKC